VSEHVSKYAAKGKRPTKYDDSCSHQVTRVEKIPGWRGRVCAMCNVIIEKFDDDENETYPKRV